LEFAVANSWQNDMVIHGFDPVLHTHSEFLAFCERHEFIEGKLNTSENKKGAKPKTS
jgi:hypothetical protein